MDSKVIDILARATTKQRDYVRERLICPTQAKAAKAIGIHRTTPYNWPNLAELEEAVDLLKLDMVDATKQALEGPSLDAVEAIRKVLRSGSDSAVVAAAKAVWDRIGLPGMSSMDVTSKGQSIQPISIVEIVSPDDGEDDGE